MRYLGPWEPFIDGGEDLASGEPCSRIQSFRPQRLTGEEVTRRFVLETGVRNPIPEKDCAFSARPNAI
jgi:hypothetical protein